ncbi:hypothetical protein EV715DRAFT_184683, partial [Schizophyllum commune]
IQLVIVLRCSEDLYVLGVICFPVPCGSSFSGREQHSSVGLAPGRGRASGKGEIAELRLMI